MTRQTSIATYNHIKDNGILSKRRWEVYSLLFQHGPATCTEIWKKHGGLQHSITPRLAELEVRGFIYEVGKRPCTFTGQNCIVWDVTDRKDPLEVVKKATTKERLEAYQNLAQGVAEQLEQGGRGEWCSALARVIRKMMVEIDE